MKERNKKDVMSIDRKETQCDEEMKGQVDVKLKVLIASDGKR